MAQSPSPSPTRRIAARVMTTIATFVVLVSPASANALKVEQCIDALNNRDYDLAIACFNEVIRLNPEDAETYNNRGQAYAARGDYQSAVVDFSEAIRLDPRHGQAYNSRGAAYSRQGDHERAIVDHSQAISLDPNNARAYYNRGVANAMKGDYQKAIVDYTDAVRIDPNNLRAYNNAAWLWATSPRAEVRDGKRAVEYATKACELTAWNNWIVLGTLAAAYAELGQFSEAINWQERMLQSPDFPDEELRHAREHLELFQQGRPIRDQI